MRSSTEQRSDFSAGVRTGSGLQRTPSASASTSSKTSPSTKSHQNVSNTERVVSSMVGGALLLSALRKPTPGSAARLLGGTALLHRGVTGHCYVYSALGRDTASSARERSAVQRSITIGKSPEELYRLWQDPKHISAIMKDFAQVEDQGDGRWRWTVLLPTDRKITWSTSPMAQRPSELISWRTEADAPFMHEGSVRFRKAPRDLGTEVTLCMSFGAENGPLRALTGKLFKTIPRTLEESILRNCKSLCEAGEIPTLEHNPDARKHPERAATPQRIASQSESKSAQSVRSLS